ncbi:tRNA pseudouridine(38-40) synthase TruA [Winogradskyella sp. DF17]|uniref:tRNA pseudouridine synthase A n=1 Tax=Winogradskyella pelagia TaxID=2819984 RepID=A0ABS3T2F9_9FLAO|nr:tRNA pseudouridine(38-40) synthase TruA [Winogradskyella sp. DF17]MBO3116939.1 tRNA pseudouridine(38-40) synthase TruA [Winogradskyella sp. DF17]
MPFEKRFYYLIKLQYLGYRFHGWQKQPNLKTLHLMVDKTLKYVFEDKKFKTLIAGRTDAMVSANETALELFTFHKIDDTSEFLNWFNYNLPQDIRALSIGKVDKDFNIIQHPKTKEYLYLFAFGGKFHPFCAPILSTIQDDLDIELMKRGAHLFEGIHNFKNYCYKATDKGLYHRTIERCELVENTLYSASFFPEHSYLLRVKGSGFGRNQIRLMMGTLIRLGKGEVDLNFIRNSLKENIVSHQSYIAPASGLILNKIDFK